MAKLRKIIHLDMDAFFASIEIRDNQALRGKPVIVGGDPEKRGVVCTCSYEARKFGVHSAMPAGQARKLCPQGIFLPVDMEKYVRVSAQIQQIFYDYTDLVEPLSIDEAYLDVTENKKHCRSATLLAQEIRERIHWDTGLTASAGVSFNKFLAKVASDINKPDGMAVITPADANEFIEKLPIGKFYGVGKVTAGKMKALGIETGKDLKNFDKAELISHFGKAGIYYYNIARGHDDREVETNFIRKSLGRETTFQVDIDNIQEITESLSELSRQVDYLLKEEGLAGRTVSLKLRYENFQCVTRSLTLPCPVNDYETIYNTVVCLLEKTEAGNRKIRLAGVSVSGFPEQESGPVQLEFAF
jgi:DNA polymerase-4